MVAKNNGKPLTLNQIVSNKPENNNHRRSAIGKRIDENAASASKKEINVTITKS